MFPYRHLIFVKGDVTSMHPSQSDDLLTYGALLLSAAALSAWWIRDDLQQGEARWDLWRRPRRRDAPELFWLSIARQAYRTALLAVGGVALVGWGLLT